MRKFTNSIIIGMTVLGLGGTALAQIPPSDNAVKNSLMQDKQDKQAKYEKRGERMQEHMAKRQADLHAKLKLSAAQEPAWKSYTDSMTPPTIAQRQAQRPDRAAMQQMPAPQRMQAMLERMQQNQARMESHLAALKTFYAALTPEQQKIFDAEFGQGRGHRRGHHRGHMGQ
ncbi:MAG: Spy/CpxP family protein refolding chaperone [Oxalobacteraceae bacterium]